MRIGKGFDVHKLVKNRDLIIGGVKIPYDRGLLGHSDADVLLHAICDALLGAAGLGDIGFHFPDTNDDYKNIDSLELLKKTGNLITRHSKKILNLDSTVFAEAPKMMSYKKQMELNISKALHISPDCVNVKATTFEGLGFVGRGEGIAAEAIALLNSY